MILPPSPNDSLKTRVLHRKAVSFAPIQSLVARRRRRSRRASPCGTLTAVPIVTRIPILPLAFLLALAACPSRPPASPVASPAKSVSPAERCAADADCHLVDRVSLGCCAGCPGHLTAMTTARSKEIAHLCGLDNGGETCPSDVDWHCEAYDPEAWRAACVDGRCAEVPR